MFSVGQSGWISNNHAKYQKSDQRNSIQCETMHTGLGRAGDSARLQEAGGRERKLKTGFKKHPSVTCIFMTLMVIGVHCFTGAGISQFIQFQFRYEVYFIFMIIISQLTVLKYFLRDKTDTGCFQETMKWRKLKARLHACSFH